MKKVTIIFIVFVSNLFSQTTELSKGIGLGAGMISGTGFSYRQLNDNHGFQITFGIMKFGDDEGYDDLYFTEGYNSEYNPIYWIPDTSRSYTEYEYGYGGSWGNIGLTYYKTLHLGKRTKFYALAGASMYYSSGSDYKRDYRYALLSDSTYSYGPVGDLEELYPADIVYFVGAGIGLEYELTDNIRLSTELPLSFSSRGLITMFIPNLAVHYYYK